MFGIALVTMEHIILKLYEYDGCTNDMSHVSKVVGRKRQVVLSKRRGRALVYMAVIHV